MARLLCVLAFRLKPFLLAFHCDLISRRDLSEGRCLLYLALVSWRCSGIRPSPATGSRRQLLVPFFSLPVSIGFLGNAFLLVPMPDRIVLIHIACDVYVGLNKTLVTWVHVLAICIHNGGQGVIRTGTRATQSRPIQNPSTSPVLAGR